MIASGNTKDQDRTQPDPLTEAKLLDVHQAVYNAGGDPSQLMISQQTLNYRRRLYRSIRSSQETFNDEVTTLDCSC